MSFTKTPVEKYDCLIIPPIYVNANISSYLTQLPCLALKKKQYTVQYLKTPTILGKQKDSASLLFYYLT